MGFFGVRLVQGFKCSGVVCPVLNALFGGGVCVHAFSTMQCMQSTMHGWMDVRVCNVHTICFFVPVFQSL